MEMTQAKKDVEFYLSKVDQAEQTAKMVARKAASGDTVERPDTVRLGIDYDYGIRERNWHHRKRGSHMV